MNLANLPPIPPSGEQPPNKEEIDRLKQEYLTRLSNSLDFMFSHPYALGSKKLRGEIMDRMEEILGMMPDDEESIYAWRAGDELSLGEQLALTWKPQIKKPKGGKK